MGLFKNKGLLSILSPYVISVFITLAITIPIYIVDRNASKRSETKSIDKNSKIDEKTINQFKRVLTLSEPIMAISSNAYAGDYYHSGMHYKVFVYQASSIFVVNVTKDSLEIVNMMR